MAGTLQISSGWARGLRLAAPQGEATRPTAAKVRAATLNRFAADLEGARFLDLFAGSGAMGLEAVSRGARACVFVEKASPALSCLRQNLAEARRRAAAQRLGEPELTVLPLAVEAALPRLAAHGPFDLVFVDPPYRDVPALAGPLLAALASVTTDGALVAFESAADDGEALAEAAAAGGVWTVLKQKAYGVTMVTVLTKNGGEDDEEAGEAAGDDVANE